MGLEVANLTASIEFVTKGEAPAQRAITNVERAVERLSQTMGNAGAESSAMDRRLQASNNRLGATVSRYDAAKKSVDEYESGLQKLLKTSADIDEQFNKISKGQAGITSNDDINALAEEGHLVKQQIENYETLASRKKKVEAASVSMASALHTQLNAQDALNQSHESDSLRGYTNQIKIATATSATFKDALRAAADEVQRTTGTTEGSAAAIAQYNALVAQQASVTVEVSGVTQSWASTVTDLNAQLAGLEGYEAATMQAAIGHAESALEASMNMDKENASAEQLAASIRALRAELERLAPLAAGGDEAAGAMFGSVSKEIETRQGLLGGARGREAGHLDTMERSAEKLGNTMSRVGGRAATAGQQMGGLVRNISSVTSASRGGVQGLSMLATSLGRLGPPAIIAAIAIATLIATFKSLKATEAVSHIAPLSESIIKLGEDSLRTETQLKPLVQQMRNFVSGEGFTNVDSVVDKMVEMGVALQNLTPSGTLEESLQLVQTLLQGGTEAARQLGLSAPKAYEAMVRSLGDNVTEAEKFIAIMTMMDADILANSDKRAAANARDQDSIEQLGYAWGQMMKSITDLLAGPLAAFIIWIADAVKGFTDIIEKAVALGDSLLGWIPDVIAGFDDLADKASVFGDLLSHLALDSIPFIGPVLSDIKMLADMGREVDSVKESYKGLGEVDGTPDLSSALSDLQAIEQAQKDFKSYLDTVNQGSNAVSAVQNLGRAMAELDKGTPTPDKVLALMNAFSQVFTVAMNGGAQALDAFENFAAGLDMGPEFDKMVSDMLGFTRDAIGGATDELGTVGVAAKDVVSPMEMAAGSFGVVASVAATAIPVVAGLRKELEAISGDYKANLYIGVSGGVGFGYTGPTALSNPTGEPSARQPYTNTNLQAPAPDVSAGTPRTSTGRGGGRAGITAANQVGRRVSNNDRMKAGGAGMWGLGGSPGGGGGGGGQDRNLAIEEIRKFIQQVNKAVMAGIRGGIVYSTAGNAIPIGGPGEFISNEGGVNIGTINLRGVWDFADPAAKREIVRQLQEALVQYQKEVA